MSSFTPPAERIWWKNRSRAELSGSHGLPLGLVMFIMMPYWHVCKQNLARAYHHPGCTEKVRRW
jgi:hypothetical protein